MVLRIVDSLFSIYTWMLIVRIFLTWIPSIDWYKQPFAFLKNAVDPFLEPFSRLIPPISGLDLSPIIAFLVLGIIRSLVIQILYHIGV